MTPADRDEIPGTDDLDTDVNLVEAGFAFSLPSDIPTPISPDEHMRRLRDATPCPIWPKTENEL